LSAVLDWEEKVGATSINHINQFPSVTISFNLAPGVPLETALNRLDKISSETLDPGVNAAAIGAAKTFQESINSAGFLLIITIVSIYIILGMLYESFIHPITILTTLPPATFGGLVILLLFNIPLSLYSFLGLVLLIGVVTAS
jgi:HAE1 family hydrophobic/amphiphilic exporter-1